MRLADLFPDENYRFEMRFEQGEAARYFEPTAWHDELIAQRVHWLRTEPSTCSALLPEGAALLEETLELAARWHGFVIPQQKRSVHERLLALGEYWEPDFLLLRSNDSGEIRLCGGCVCFPSSWRLSDKMGQSIDFIHSPVPGLNASIGASIHKFLSRLKGGIAWQRTNWGLTASPELNQNPERRIPRLTAGVHLDDVWLRVEHQALMALPASGGILFGIRIAVHPLAEVRSDETTAAKLRRSLETMPLDMACYKNILDAKETLIALLSSNSHR